MKILDLSAGNRAVWFDKKNPLCTFLDKRDSVRPDIVCDTRELDPEIIGSGYQLIVFDPPHMNCGPNSNMSKRYGYHKTAEILDIVERTGRSVLGVCTKDALMALKWNDHDIKLERVLDLLPSWSPLFGHQLRNMGGVSKARKTSQSYWVMLLRGEK